MTHQIAVSNRWIGVPLLYGAVAGLAGCTAAIPPLDTISTADASVNRAIDSQAAQHAPLELRLAREKLDGAKSALNEEDYTRARRLAEEARADAQLAEAKARSERARLHAQEVQQAIETLEREADRKITNQ